MDIDREELKNLIREVMREDLPVSNVPMGDRWQGGKMYLEPKTEGMAVKEIPIETFFHKIVMVRDRLRVMEQKINGNKKLTDEEKIDLQQYITRIYGSLTSFNILFKHKDDQFRGDSG